MCSHLIWVGQFVSSKLLVLQRGKKTSSYMLYDFAMVVLVIGAKGDNYAIIGLRGNPGTSRKEAEVSHTGHKGDNKPLEPAIVGL